VKVNTTGCTVAVILFAKGMVMETSVIVPELASDPTVPVAEQVVV